MSMYKSGSTDFLERRVYNGQLGLIIKLDFDEENVLYFIQMTIWCVL